MVKMVVGEEHGEGELATGHNVEIGYYAQIQEKTLNQESTVEKVIEDAATGDNAKIKETYKPDPNDSKATLRVESDDGNKTDCAALKFAKMVDATTFQKMDDEGQRTEALGNSSSGSVPDHGCKPLAP